MRCVSPHVSPQVVEKFCPLVWEMGKRTWACAGVACPALPLLSPAGAWRFWLPVDSAAVVPEGAACPLCRRMTLPFVFFPAPYPPDPLPRRGRGSPRLFHARGCAPCIPGVEPAVTAKPTEFLYLEQCRQPRRGGTGGDGTIRRTRRRRLRWSSPPGQVEQMPHGERSPAPPRRAAPEQGRIARWRRGLPCLAGSAGVSGTRLRRGGFGRRLDLPPLSPAGGLPPRFSFHALTGAAGCDILVYRTEPPRRTARKQKETQYRTAIPERRKGENRA